MLEKFLKYKQWLRGGVLILGLLKNSGEQERLSPAIVRLSVKRLRSGARVLVRVGVVVKLVPSSHDVAVAGQAGQGQLV